MATFSVNQVRHLYVADHVADTVTAADEKATIALKLDNAKQHMYFSYKGATDLMRSDLINIKDVLYVKATDASKMARNLKEITIALNSEVNGGKPVVGQDYIVRIAFRQYLGMSDEDQYFKYGMVHAYAGMDASIFYQRLAASLYQNFSRETSPLLTIKLDDTVVAGTTTINGQTAPTDATGTIINTTSTSKLTLTEVEQPWQLGTMESVPVYFDVQPMTITVEGDEVLWATITSSKGDSIGNGKTIADLEYFCMGERGDMYRNMGWPNVIPTKYLVDSEKEYHTLDIHCAYVGANESVQKSEKTITIVSTDKDAINTLVEKLKTATGLDIATL